MSFQSATSMAHRFARYHVQTGDHCIDATVGNGNDTVFLSGLVGEKGKVIGVDIEDQALENTRKLLEESGVEGRVVLKQADHKDLLPVTHSLGWDQIALAMFNLGYLPHADKGITTKPKSTMGALDACLDLLCNRGAISIVAYRGHQGGKEEESVVHKWMSRLNSNRFNSIRFEKGLLVEPESPVFYWVERC